jgi:MoaA/NifB/PqqE/SkfB family radical SAM enzyme
VEDLRLFGTSLVELAGTGEPLLHPDAISMIRTIKQAGLRALLITNGALLTRELCHELVGSGLDSINVSLNAATDATHARLHGAPPGDRTRILEMAQHLRRARDNANRSGPFISVSIVVEKENYQEIPFLTEQAVQLGADLLYFAPLGVNPASLHLLMTREQDEQARTLVRAADAFARAAGTQTNAADFLDRPLQTYWTRELLSRTPCHIGQIYSRVHGTGEVYPCAASLRRCLGDLNTTRFRGIWHSEEYRRFRREAMALPRSQSKVRGCQCWSCGQHFLIKQYNEWAQSGQLGQMSRIAAQPSGQGQGCESPKAGRSWRPQ